MAKTLYDKFWEDHVVHQEADGTALLYIDRHLVHEVTSPQAFAGLKLAGRKPRRVSSIVSTRDHNTPTDYWDEGIKDPISRPQVETLGAFACLAHGIGTSEVEHAVATQCLMQKKSKTMLIAVDGRLGKGVAAKDVARAIIGIIGTAGGTGYAIEFGGSAVRGLSMEGRMTLCNMAIEGGARMGFVAVDDTTIDYLRGRPFSPRGETWDRAVAYWRTLHSDPGARFDRVVTLKAEAIRPPVTWGTFPEMVVPIDAVVPDPAKEADPLRLEGMERALQYMGLHPHARIGRSAIDKVFIGSFANSRIEDQREAASVLKECRVGAGVKLALALPGSGLVSSAMAAAASIAGRFADVRDIL